MNYVHCGVFKKEMLLLSCTLNLLRTLRAHFILQNGASDIGERGIKELSHGFFTFVLYIDFFLVGYYADAACK